MGAFTSQAVVSAAMFVMAALLPSVARAEPPATSPTFRFGEPIGTVHGLVDPVDVTVDAAGHVLIVESVGGRVIRLSADLPKALSSRGAIDASDSPDATTLIDGLLRPTAIALGSDGTIYVAEAGRRRIGVFDKEGTRDRSLMLGGRLVTPVDIAVRNDRLLAIADPGAAAVHLLNPGEGTVRTWRGAADEPLSHPSAVSFDAAGLLWITDTNRMRVLAVDVNAAEPELKHRFGDFGPFPGLLDEPTDITMRGGQLHIVDRRNHRVQIMSPDGELVEPWGTHALLPHEGDGKIHYPDAVAIARDGSFAAIVEGIEDRVQLFAASNEAYDPNAVVPAGVDSSDHFGPRLAYDEPILLVSEPERHFCYLFDLRRSPAFIFAQFGERGRGFGLLMRTGAMVVNRAAREILLADIAKRRVQRFSFEHADDPSQLKFSLRSVNFTGGGPLEARPAASYEDAPPDPVAARLDPRGGVWLVDASAGQLVHLDDAGTVTKRVGRWGDEPGEFRAPNDVALTRDGEHLLVVDRINQRVQAIDRDGTPIGMLETPPGGFLDPFGIVAGVDGFVYVTDRARHQILVFEESGRFVRAMLRVGAGHERLWKPGGIVQRSDGNLIVVDWGNHRLKMFRPDGAWVMTFGTGRTYTPERPGRAIPEPYPSDSDDNGKTGERP